MSTSTQTTHHTNDTVLTTDQDAESGSPTTRTVVIALDHSSYSQKAFNWALTNILKKETDLVFICLTRSLE